MLHGVRVVEMGTVITAPLAAMMLGDMGAEVIKIERPEGDPFRRARGGTYSPNFVAFNRNKRSVALDLTQERDRAAMQALVARSDVLLDNFRPGVLDRLGLEPATLRARYPRLIQCSITGFGDVGPYRLAPAFDAVSQAHSGIASMMVDPEQPEAFGPTIGDNATGMYAASAILAALYERQQTGQGKRLEVNMLESSMAFITDNFALWTQMGVETDRYSRVAASQSFSMRCADGLPIAVHLSAQDKFWYAILGAIGDDPIARDERFANRPGRIAYYRELQRELNRCFQMQPRAEWERRLTAADVPFAPINTVQEVLADSQVAALGTLFQMPHPTLGETADIHFPVLADGTRLRMTYQRAPLLGEHTDEVLAWLEI
jgi:crotonobetainyl-CoA:carnitine CoA-transferase CaiB-like acyl-CoA transferase